MRRLGVILGNDDVQGVAPSCSSISQKTRDKKALDCLDDMRSYSDSRKCPFGNSSKTCTGVVCVKGTNRRDRQMPGSGVVTQGKRIGPLRIKTLAQSGVHIDKDPLVPRL